MDNWVPGAAERTYVGQGAYIDGATPSSGAYTYLTHDHLGSVRGGWSGGKARLASNEFMAYGETRVESGQRIDLGYTGHKWDAETKQYFAPYRYYSPGSSRWMSRDPLGFVDGPNVYGYGLDNPISNVDPSGGTVLVVLWPLLAPIAGEGIGAALGGIAYGCAFIASAGIAAVGITQFWSKGGRSRPLNDDPEKLKEELEEAKRNNDKKRQKEIQDKLDTIEKFNNERNKQKRQNGKRNPPKKKPKNGPNTPPPNDNPPPNCSN